VFAEVRQVLEAAERAGAADLNAILPALRRLSFDEFGEVMFSFPNPGYPALSRLLPRMAGDDVQIAWTGACGFKLLRESLYFVRTLWHTYERSTGQALCEARILDYGCGYGRMLRLMLYFADTQRLFGCDPWSKSIDLCRDAGLACDLKVTDYLPLRLPYADRGFDLVYAYSVFTHTSRRATDAAMQAIAAVLKPQGLLCITLRPAEFWDYDYKIPEAERAELKRRHAASGFAFRPHNVIAVDGDLTYGDATCSLTFLEKQYPDWRIVGSERTVLDPYQRVVYLQQRG